MLRLRCKNYIVFGKKMPIRLQETADGGLKLRNRNLEEYSITWLTEVNYRAMPDIFNVRRLPLCRRGIELTGIYIYSGFWKNIYIFSGVHVTEISEGYRETRKIWRLIAVGVQSNGLHCNVTPRCLLARRVFELVREVTCTHTWPAPDGAI